MKLAKKWNRRIFAAVLGAVVMGAPLFAVHADPAFSRDGERYDVRRGMYEKEGGSDEHIPLGQYADADKRAAREEERREDAEKRKAEEAKEAKEAKEEKTHEARKESGEQKETREYAYDVRRGMYEQEGGSDTQVRRGMYEQPSEDGERRGLVR